MMQRWSKTMTEPLRTFLRRGALFVLGSVIAVVATVSPMMTQRADAAPLDFGLGGNSCAIETVGWVICPTMRTIARLADKGFTYINQSSLGINYELFDQNGKTFNAWQVMRNIANGLFVIVFLFFIYGYLSGKVNGVFSLKRLLPRLLIAAIVVNISFYLAVILVDISNILGDAIWNAMKGIYGNGSPVMPLGARANPLADGNLTKMTAAAMGNTTMVWVLLPPIAAVAITIAVICGAAVILIILREALVTTLILAAPILIVLYLLPNMERFSGQAMRLFFQLLMLYPLIAILLGTGQIVSLAVGGWDSPTALYGGGTLSIIPDLVAAAAAVVPLLGIWFLFKNMNSIMSTAGSRLSASVAGQRGNKNDDKNARVTGKATAGAAGNKNTAGIGGPFGNRRQAFSRNKRRRSLSGSALAGSGAEPVAGDRAGMATKRPIGESDALQNSIRGGIEEDPAKKLEEQQSAKLEGNADGINVESAVAAAMAAGGTTEQEKQKTAKDIFNNLNHAHESKDKDRKLNAGQQPAGGASNGGSNQPVAPTTSYRAPSMAQSGNIVSGTSTPSQPVQVIAVPVQIDGSALLGQQGKSEHRPPDNVSQPPISGTEEKAKARAQKYLFDADRQTADTDDKIDILGGNKAPAEPPHTTPVNDDKEHGS